MTDIVFVGQFIASKAGKTGLTVTVDVDRYTISDGSRTALITAGSAIEGRRGLYHYRLASADLSLYQYVATFITADATVDQQEIAAIGLVVPDALVSSRLAPTAAGRTLDVSATGEAGLDFTNRLDTIGILPDAVSGGPGGLAIVGSEMGLANDAITAGKFDESTAFPLKFADTGSTKVARVGADSDTLETLSDQLDAIQAIIDGIDTSAVTVTTSNNAGKLTIERTATFAATVSGLAIPADWLAVIWTVKGAASDDDDDAVLQVRVSNPAVVLTDGLQRIEGVAPSGSLTIASGSCTVNQAGGTVVLALKAAATAALTVRGGAAWDLRVLRPPTGEADELTTGTADIVYTVTHART